MVGYYRETMVNL